GEAAAGGGGGDAGIGIRVDDRVVRRGVDGPRPPPALGGLAHLGRALPRDRVGSHRSAIRRCAAKIRASAPAPSSAATRKARLLASPANSSRSSPTYAATTPSAK